MQAALGEVKQWGSMVKGLRIQLCLNLMRVHGAVHVFQLGGFFHCDAPPRPRKAPRESRLGRSRGEEGGW